MELREFAERVLHGRSLEDKLAPLTDPTDRRPGPAAPLPAAPGRPAGLAIDRASRAPLPGRGQLDRPEARAALLHSFANHELLALELMALVLLRFPEAPAAFRRGLAQTLEDEQRHLSLYIRRMGELGLDFGAHPLNGFFWDTVADAPTPLDFVARMSLVFEQANLDFARSFGAIFAQVGDGRTAALMDRVYRDELRHVRHGLSWFRRWKTPGASDWEAWVRLLQQPLQPGRAKGHGFSRQVRQEVGLDADFTERLALWSRSRGRPPVLWLFNPACELEIAAGPGHQPPRPVRELAEDLSLVPALLAQEDDAVLVPRLPGRAFRAQMAAAGLPLPELVPEDRPGALAGRTLTRLEPWGWSPAAARRLAGHAPRAQAGRRGWEPGLARAFSKAWSHPLRRGLLAEAPEADRAFLAPPEHLGAVARSLDEVDARLAELLAAHGQAVIKAPLGAAGREAARVTAPLQGPRRRWVQGVLAAQGAVVVEPWLDRVADLSLHVDLEPGGGHRIRGWTCFFTDAAGRFEGAAVSSFRHWLPTPVLRLLTGDGRDPRRLDRVAGRVAAALAPALAEAGHAGPVGVDALVYRDGAGTLRLHPAVEVNPRWTMGRVGLALRRAVRPGLPALWRVVAPGAVDLAAHPPRREEDRLVGGLLPTSDPDQARRALGVLAVGPEARLLAPEDPAPKAPAPEGAAPRRR